MSAVELSTQPPVTVEYTGAKYATRVFRLFAAYPSREALIAAPELIDPNLPPRSDNWMGLLVDRLDVIHGDTTTDVVYSYSNTQQFTKTSASFQTEQMEIPYFEWRQTDTTGGYVNSYMRRAIQVPFKVMRLRVRVQFSTGQSAWSLSSFYRSAAQYTNAIFDLTGTSAFAEPVGDAAKLWLLEGADMEETQRYLMPNGASASWVTATYSFMREPGLAAGENIGFGGIDETRFSEGRLPTAWRAIRGPNQDENTEDIWPPSFRSVLLNDGPTPKWKVPPFERVIGKAYGANPVSNTNPHIPSFRSQPIAVLAPIDAVLPGLL